MRTVVIQADDPVARYRVLRRIQRQWGPAARLVVQEFLANAAEHCSDHRVNLTLHRRKETPKTTTKAPITA